VVEEEEEMEMEEGAESSPAVNPSASDVAQPPTKKSRVVEDDD